MNYPIAIEIREYFLCYSLLILITSLVMFYNKDYTIAFFLFILFITSINFWRNPMYDIRRTMDMTMCKIIAIFFFINSFTVDEFNRLLTYCVLLVFIIFNTIEFILWYFDNYQWVIFHLAMHIYMAYFPLLLYYVL